MGPKDLSKTIPKSRLLNESEWRSIGVQQSRGWQHYAIHRPEPHILLFRRPLGTDPQSGRVDAELERMARDEYKHQMGLIQCDTATACTTHASTPSRSHCC